MKNDLVFYPENSANWRSIQTTLEGASRLFITTHVNPDGDAIGSEMAIGRFLIAMGKQVRIINESQTPVMYAFLDPDSMIESFDVAGERLFHDAPERDDAVLFLDLGDYERAGQVAGFLMGGGARTIIVDHHKATPAFADIAVVNPHAESTGSLVYDLMRAINPSLINSPIAEAVLTAVVTDTGYFTFSNTTSTTMTIASSLYTYGISMHGLRKRIESTQPFGRQKLLGLCLAQVALADHGRIAWSYITTEMFERSGSSREYTDGIINHIRVIEGIAVALLVIQEEPLTWKISLRSLSGVRVNDIAARLGGGGHERAAGATLSGTIEEVSQKTLDTIAAAFDAEDKNP